MSDWHGPGSLYARWQSLSRLHSFVAFMMVAFCPLALLSKRPLHLVIILLICSRIFYLMGRYFSQSAGFAMVGAIGEDDVASTLRRLPSTWKVERNVQLEGNGDVDFLVTSPENSIFLIDAKAHAGTVFFDGTRLSRRLRGRQKPFEKDFLSKVKQQAVQIRTERKLPYVNTILVFTRAEVQIPESEIGHVKVISLKELLSYLQSSTKEMKPKVVVKNHLRLIAAKEKASGDNIRKLSESEQIKMLAKSAGVVPLDRSYSIRLHDCWSCSSRIFVLDWPHHKKWDKRMPPHPVPCTLQLRFSQVTGDEHWANTCFLCGQTQGDFYVFEEKSPFRWFSTKKELLKTSS